MSLFESIDGSSSPRDELELPAQQIWERLVMPTEDHTELVNGFRSSLAKFAKSKGLHLDQIPSAEEAKVLTEIKQGFVNYVGEALAHDSYSVTNSDDSERLSVEFHSEFVLRGPDGKVEIALLGTVHKSHQTYLIFDHAKQPIVVPSPAMTILMSGTHSENFCINPIYSPAAIEYLWALMNTDLQLGKMREHSSPFLDCVAAAAATEFGLAEEQVYALMLNGDFEMTADWKIVFEIDDCPYIGEIQLNSEGTLFMVESEDEE